MKEKFLSDNWNFYEVNFQGLTDNDSVLAHNHGLEWNRWHVIGWANDDPKHWNKVSFKELRSINIFLAHHSEIMSQQPSIFKI